MRMTAWRRGSSGLFLALEAGLGWQQGVTEEQEKGRRRMEGRRGDGRQGGDGEEGKRCSGLAARGAPLPGDVSCVAAQGGERGRERGIERRGGER